MYGCFERRPHKDYWWGGHQTDHRVTRSTLHPCSVHRMWGSRKTSCDGIANNQDHLLQAPMAFICLRMATCFKHDFYQQGTELRYLNSTLLIVTHFPYWQKNAFFCLYFEGRRPFHSIWHRTYYSVAASWPVKSYQMSLKVAQKWFNWQNERFWLFYKNCLKCGQFGQNDCCHSFLKLPKVQ